MFAKSKFFIVSSLMVTIFSQTDKIMLKAMMSDEAVGIYSAAVTCAGLTSFVFSAIIDSFRPAIFENKKNSNQAYEKSLISCYSVVIYMSLAQSLVCTVFSKIIIGILYGDGYADAAKVLALVVWYTTFSYLGPIRNVWILAENKQKYLWIINLSGALTNVVLNAVFIPIWGVMGAALASLITQIFTNVIVGFIIKPIRYNNCLMLRGCNPKPLFSYCKQMIKNKKRQ
jgi:O-antigen/teichoic acid export membrane protein